MSAAFVMSWPFLYWISLPVWSVAGTQNAMFQVSRYQQARRAAGADAQGIHVTSHSRQIIRLPILGTPRWPQFQHSLGSAFCWFPLIVSSHPAFVPAPPP